MAAKQAMKENMQCTSKYGHLRISQLIIHVILSGVLIGRETITSLQITE